MQIEAHDLYKVLQAKFGFSTFKLGQLEIIHHLCNSKNVLAVLPTGTGKSLIYQLLGYLLNRPVLVISPLISLIDDQVARLNRLGEKHVVGLTSKLDHNQREFTLNHLRNYRFIYLSPEMATQPEVLNALKQLDYGLFVIDEAHCLSQWGPDFRPDYLKLKDLLSQLGSPTTLMLTATATKSVREDILKKMGFHSDQVEQVVYSVDRPNIYLEVEHCETPAQKNKKLFKLLKMIKGSGIIYFSSKKIANQMTELIAQQTDRSVAAYHADVSLQDRYRIQQQFMLGKVNVICATSAFGMGIDKNNVRFVIHYHMPGNLEDYLQEIGRAGRDQQPSIAILLYTAGDEYIPSTLNMKGFPSASNVQTFFAKPESRASFEPDQKQLLTYYHDQHKSAQEVSQIFENRQVAKQNSLMQMLNFVNEENCLRNNLLTHFGEQEVTHNANCCGIDCVFEAVATLKLTETSEVEQDSNQSLSLVPWQTRLNQLFSQKK
ncbi:RecQ family ATP-dependent DNA helicase [Pediococcus ethanolidurans]|uniref:RecQ family ATP-dependent DNA helicase n=1 Tax=Pediococcus ethanolidurans TaxID=319653 RepID=UPI002953A823|nr:RecQ family ATP-dependent DNA helicase [Pediococcus ethanolidurans]